MDEGQDLILRKDGKASEDVEAILSNLYQQNQKMEKEMAEFRAVAMEQRETMERTEKVVTKLESRINEQESKMAIMTQEIRQLKTNMNERETILKHVLQENERCAAELQSAKQSIEHIEKVVVNIEQSYENIEDAHRKAIIKSSGKIKLSQNKKIGTKDLDKSTTMESGRTVSTRKFQGVNNITSSRTDINRFSESGKGISKQLKFGKRVLQKRNITTEGVAFSAYLNHNILHMGAGHTIKCNQVLLNDGNHYNSFTGIFTVPQTGVYLLTFSFGVEHINDVTEVRLVVNNREIVDAGAQAIGTLQRSTSGNTAIIKLNQGESVWIESLRQDSEVVSGQGYRWTTFSGVLLYQQHLRNECI